jgi:hypothetical protein
MIRSHWLLLGTLAVGACGEDTLIIPPPEPGPTPGIQLTLEQPGPVIANVIAMQSTAGTATLVRSEGFTGAVTLSAESLPTGWEVAFSPAIVPGNVTTSLVIVTTPANLAPGSYSFLIRANVIGVTSTTADMTVAVNVEQGS